MGPCKNSNCHSFGKVHPNCKCYGYANGGRVEHFCSISREHDKTCEYYSEGGEIDASQVKLDAPEEIDPSQVQIDEEIPHDQVVADTDGGPLEQIKAGLEGAAQGAIGPLAPLAETKLGISTPEAINKRAKDFPITHGVAEAGTLAAGLLTGAGEAGLIAKGAGMASEAAGLGKIGSAVLKGAIEATAFQGADEISKGILGQADPEAPVSAAILHMGAAGLFGAASGGIFGTVAQGIEGGLKKVQNQKTIDAAEKFLAELGESKDPLQKLGVNSEKIAKYASDYISFKATGGKFGEFEVVKKLIEPHIKKISEKAINRANPYVVDAIIGCMLKNETSALPQAIHYATQIGKAVQKTNSAMDAIFKAGAQQVVDKYSSDKSEEQIEKYLQDGAVEEQMKNTLQQSQEPSKLAEGGEVQSPRPDGFSTAFPEQNILLNQAKGRVSNYLNSIRPSPNPNKLPFDKQMPDKQKQREYKNALSIAAEPLSILNKVQTGKLTAEDMRHFSQMLPEGYRYLSKEMTKKIMQSQMKGESPPYKKRLAMSLFLGANLDSSTTPMTIQTIQNMYAAKKMQQQNQMPVKNSKNTSSLSKASNQYLTDDQAVSRRQQSEKA